MTDPLIVMPASEVRQMIREELARATRPVGETMTLDEVAALARLNPATVRRHAAAGKLRGSSVGRKWVFQRADVEAYVGKGHD